MIYLVFSLTATTNEWHVKSGMGINHKHPYKFYMKFIFIYQF